MSIYVDNLLQESRSHSTLDRLKNQLIKEFYMKDLGEAKIIIGLEIS